ncbi:MAG: hypothetical protein P9L93_02935 [Candidatus Gorgyraea atricola]|nr:hypothetical protein [Candidatus Gorgyraea atricola]
MVNIDTLAVLLILLPGFLSKGIIDGLVPRKKTSPINNIIEALMLSFLAYALLLWTSSFFPSLKIFTQEAVSKKQLSEIAANLNFANIIFLLSVSIILGLLFTKIIHTQWYYAIMRKLNITY